MNLLVLILLIPASISLLGGCSRERPRQTATVSLVFKHGRIAGDPEAFEEILRGFEAENPGIRVRDEILPSSSDEQHQYFVINLEGGASDLDVLSMDVIWVPEFSRAGWLRDLSPLLPPDRRGDFFRGPIDAVTQDGGVFAVPWYIDAGILYYRKDLLELYGFDPPGTWDELVREATAITRAEPGLYGFLWQGKQYEGLVCNALEYIWSYGGDILRDGRAVVDSPENRLALAFMRDMIYRYRITPEFVLTSTEEPVRRIFGEGKAVFMRNWPYAWTLFQREGSPVRGKVGVCPLPGTPGREQASTLGGWQLGINCNSRHPEEAERLVRYLTSARAQKQLALSVGYMPSRKALYRDEELIRARPFMAPLYVIFEHARPRPVTPYYMMISQVMQPELSAVISRIKEPGEALEDASEQIDFLMEADGR
jgi:multiple sugar transport system substrate-binding protein